MKSAPPIAAFSSLVLAIVALLGGCGTPTTELKRDSLAGWETTMIGGVAAPAFLRGRSAIVVSGTERVQLLPDGRSLMAGSEDDRAGGGAAVHVGDGYWLTAAHSVRSEPVTLVRMEEGGTSHLMRARVVWRGQMSEPGGDIALVHVPPAAYPDGARQIPLIQLSPEVPTHGRVLCLGSGLNSNAWSGGEIVGGRISDDRMKAMVHHTAPISKGDSGGPAMLEDGRLAGINYQAVLRVTDGKGSADAAWMSPAFLSALIEQDQAGMKGE